jgi:isocitrate dehydrogenase
MNAPVAEFLLSPPDQPRREQPPRTLRDAGLALPVPVSVAHGDGIGPEIMAATLSILDAAGARIAVEPIELGANVYGRGASSGIEATAWASVRRTGVLLKAPVTTPRGGGFKSLNVTLRKSLGLFANVRPCVSLHPFVATRHPGMNVVVIRENEEDVYAGIEHRQTRDVLQCLKVVSIPGTERIVRYAFDWARAHGRRKVTCMTKDNIMKMTDGLFSETFGRIGAEYPDLAQEHLLVDIGAALLADDPGRFDVVVTPNLYGDILSDVAAQLAGSVGLAGSANVGAHGAMFEAIHGSAPAIAGKDVANPSGLIQAAVMMLIHVGQADVAARVHNAWLATIEDGVHTADIWNARASTAKVGTRAFAAAVIARLGAAPGELPPARWNADCAPVRVPVPSWTRRRERKDLVGIDVFVEAPDANPEALAARLSLISGDVLALSLITNRGVKVWPGGLPETFCTDHWRCRFTPRRAGRAVTHEDVVALLARLAFAGIDFVKTEQLYDFDGKPGYSLGQGQ